MLKLNFITLISFVQELSPISRLNSNYTVIFDLATLWRVMTLFSLQCSVSVSLTLLLQGSSSLFSEKQKRDPTKAFQPRITALFWLNPAIPPHLERLSRSRLVKA